jgi:hypothetical protein
MADSFNGSPAPVLIFNMSIRNHAYTRIDFDFVDLLRFATSVLRLPRPHGERRTGFDFNGEPGAAKINLLPLGLG